MSTTGTATAKVIPSTTELLARIAELESAIAAKHAAARVSLKVSEKGAVSAYGLGRFPVTLYAEQWVRLLAHADEVKSFIEANRSQLSVKNVEKSADSVKF